MRPCMQGRAARGAAPTCAVAPATLQPLRCRTHACAADPSPRYPSHSCTQKQPGTQACPAQQSMPRHRPRPPVAALAAWALAALLAVAAQEKPAACERTHIGDWTDPETGTADYNGVMGETCKDDMGSCSPACKRNLQRVRGAGILLRTSLSLAACYVAYPLGSPCLPLYDSSLRLPLCAAAGI